MHRLFKFEHGFKYVTHRPPTVVDRAGKNLREQRWLNGAKMKKKYHVFMYHYCLVFPKQVREKTQYYTNLYSHEKNNDFRKWADNNFFELLDPFHVHNTY